MTSFSIVTTAAVLRVRIFTLTIIDPGVTSSSISSGETPRRAAIEAMNAVWLNVSTDPATTDSNCTTVPGSGSGALAASGSSLCWDIKTAGITAAHSVPTRTNTTNHFATGPYACPPEAVVFRFIATGTPAPVFCVFVLRRVSVVGGNVNVVVHFFTFRS